MKINCIHGWKRTGKIGTLTIENSSVEIFNDVCNYADKCGITHCRFYDVSREGTRRYLEGLAHSRTLEGLFEEESRKAAGNLN